MVKSIFRKFAVKCLLLVSLSILLSFDVIALKQLLSLQGKVDFNGVLIDDGNLTVQIHDSPSGGVILYEDFFNDTIQNGFFDVMLGNGTVLDLNLSQTYYMDLKVNGSDLNFSGNDRRIFQSPVGFKLSGLENFSVDTDVLFVDTENNNVGIGTTGPAEKLVVIGNVNISDSLNVSNTVQATTFIGDGSSLTGITTTTSVWNSSENLVYLNDSNADVNVSQTVWSQGRNITQGGFFKSYNSTLGEIVNSLGPVTTLKFTIPANDFNDGDMIFVWLAYEQSNSQGATRKVTHTVQVGDATNVSYSTKSYENSGAKNRTRLIFNLNRIGNDVIVSKGGTTFDSSPGDGADVFVSTPSSFTSDMEVKMNTTMEVAHSTLYVKPRRSIIYKIGAP
jgi:hypothetical protein|tara:strand:- start:1392 stop:2564 length:1173 start_codon:yes stop_codon:yes gene_type:complete